MGLWVTGEVRDVVKMTQRFRRMSICRVDGDIVVTVAFAVHLHIPQHQGDGGERRRIRRECPEHSRAEPGGERPQAVKSVRLHAAVGKTLVLVIHVGLYLRLHDVQGVRDDPGAYPGHAAGEQQPERSDLTTLAWLQLAAHPLERHEVEREARRVPRGGQTETAERAAQTLRLVDLEHAVNGAGVRVPRRLELMPRLALALDLHARLGELHRATDDRLCEPADRARHKVCRQTVRVIHAALNVTLHAKHNGINRGQPIEGRGHSLVKTQWLKI